MTLQQLAGWVAEIAAITDGGHVTLDPHEAGGLAITVNWEQAGDHVQSRHLLSAAEVARSDGAPPAGGEALHRITVAVREVMLLEAEADDATPDA